MATELRNTTTIVRPIPVRSKKASVLSKAELIAGLEAAVGAGYILGLTTMVMSWIHGSSIWTPFNAAASALMPTSAELTTSFVPGAFIFGWLVYFGLSMVLGLVFATVYSRFIKADPSTGMPVIVGFALGGLSWGGASLGIIPLLNPEVYGNFAFLIVFMIFGATIGLLYPLFATYNRNHFESLI